MINQEQKRSAQEERSILDSISRFSVPDNKRALLEIAFTLGAFAFFFSLMIYSLGISYWLTLILLIPTAALLTRTFTIQHDCGHASYFSSLKVNNFTGSLLGIMTLTPYHYWRRNHRYHHTFSGNLDRRGIGDLDTYTIDEYKSLPAYRKLWYRIYRNPVFMLIVGSMVVFGIKHRLPLDNPFNSIKSWTNIMITNLGIGVVIASIVYFLGWETLLLVYLPVCVLASIIGIALFFIHHQYEDTYWALEDKWSHFDAALRGSSYFEFAKFPSWIISNINLHHIHHLNGRIPFYRLRECLEAIPGLMEVPKRTFKDIPNCFRLALWDEKRNMLVAFSAV